MDNDILNKAKEIIKQFQKQEDNNMTFLEYMRQVRDRTFEYLQNSKEFKNAISKLHDIELQKSLITIIDRIYNIYHTLSYYNTLYKCFEKELEDRDMIIDDIKLNDMNIDRTLFCIGKEELEL